MHRTRLRTRAGGGNSWTPANFGSRLLFWQDPSDLTVAWQDSARTTPVEVDQPVGSRQNKGTLAIYMQQATAGSRPVLKQSTGYYYEETDGLDDGLVSSAAVNLSAFDKLSVCVGLLRETDAAGGMPHQFGSNSTDPGSYFITAPGSAAANLEANLRGDSANSSWRPATAAAPFPCVFTVIFDLTGATRVEEVIPYINGTLSQSGGSAGPAGGGNFSSSRSFHEGRRNNSDTPFFGRMYQRIVVSGAITAAEQAQLEAFVRSKMGL